MQNSLCVFLPSVYFSLWQDVGKGMVRDSPVRSISSSSILSLGDMSSILGNSQLSSEDFPKVKVRVLFPRGQRRNKAIVVASLTVTILQNIISELCLLIFQPPQKINQFSRSVVSDSLQPHGLQHAHTIEDTIL